MFFLSSIENDDQFETIVRVAQRNDVSELATTIVACFYNFPPILSWINPLLKLTISEDLRYRLKNSPLLYCCLVATKNLEIAGTVEISLQKPWWSNSCASWWTLTAQSPYISNLAVNKNYRRLGIGSQLLARCEQIALDWGYQETRLNVLDSNESAKQLYCHNGYQILQVEASWGKFWLDYSPRLLLRKRI